jgi:hypothetical protein
LDSLQLISAARQMRDQGQILGGDPLSQAPHQYIGAAANPFADPFYTGSCGWPKRSRPGRSSSKPNASITWTAFPTGWIKCGIAIWTGRCIFWEGSPP